jgi:hypothetical protein
MGKRSRSRTRWTLAGALAVALLVAPQASTSTKPDDRGARLSSADSASEYWDIVADFDNGYSLFARFMITNEGPGSRTAFATWYLVDPEKKLHPFRNGRRKGRWSLDSDGRHIEIGSSVFDQSGAVHRLEYDSSKRQTYLNFQFSPREPAGWADPQVFGKYSIALLDLGTPVTGTIQLKGMSEPVSVRGSIFVTHIWMEKSEAALALRRIEFSSSGDGTAIYVSDLTTPSGEHHRWLVVERDGAEILRTTDFQLQLGDSATKSAKGGYPTPDSLQIRAREFEGTIQTNALLVAVDPLEDIPQPFRFLLSLKTRPHRVWMRSTFELRLRTDTEQTETILRGSGVTTITFLNPLPPTVTRSETGNSGA